MSLTRVQLETIWHITKQLERDTDYLYFKRKDVTTRMKKNIKIIRDYVEQVIGQVE